MKHIRRLLELFNGKIKYLLWCEGLYYPVALILPKKFESQKETINFDIFSLLTDQAVINGG